MSSGDVMTFPKTWEEYEECYGFNDTEQIYTNGSRLIQSSRVKQWLEHIEVNEDCISREDAEKCLMSHFIPQTYTGDDVEQASKLARKIMSNAPSVIPTQTNAIQHVEIVEKPKEAEWIPCSERLPSKGVAVLVNGTMYDAPPITISTDAPYYYEQGWINAWMPLPEPWKGAEECF